MSANTQRELPRTEFSYVERKVIEWKPPQLNPNVCPVGILRPETIKVKKEVFSLRTGNRGIIQSYDPDYRNGHEKGWMTIRWNNGKISEGPVQDKHNGAFAQIRLVDPEEPNKK